MDYPVPPVSWEDLLEFQARHFVPRSSNVVQNYASPRYDEEDPDDDGLGYYHDGVKRTLTDEQIEIFRHSEIQNLLRERRLKAEREGEEDTEDSLSGSNENVDGDMVDNANEDIDDIAGMPQTQHVDTESDPSRSSATKGKDSGHLDSRSKAKYPESGGANEQEQQQHAVNHTPVYSRRIVTYGD